MRLTGVCIHPQAHIERIYELLKVHTHMWKDRKKDKISYLNI